MSTSSGSKCYDYHIGAILDQNEKHAGSRSKYLDRDHDASNNRAYNNQCPGSHPEFGTSLAGFAGSDIDKIGLYDFYSTSQ